MYKANGPTRPMWAVCYNYILTLPADHCPVPPDGPVGVFQFSTHWPPSTVQARPSMVQASPIRDASMPLDFSGRNRRPTQPLHHFKSRLKLRSGTSQGASHRPTLSLRRHWSISSCLYRGNSILPTSASNFRLHNVLVVPLLICNFLFVSLITTTVL